jgi:hypothetical protein
VGSPVLGRLRTQGSGPRAAHVVLGPQQIPAQAMTAATVPPRNTIYRLASWEDIEGYAVTTALLHKGLGIPPGFTSRCRVGDDAEDVRTGPVTHQRVFVRGGSASFELGDS